MSEKILLVILFGNMANSHFIGIVEDRHVDNCDVYNYSLSTWSCQLLTKCYIGSDQKWQMLQIWIYSHRHLWCHSPGHKFLHWKTLFGEKSMIWQNVRGVLFWAADRAPLFWVSPTTGGVHGQITAKAIHFEKQSLLPTDINFDGSSGWKLLTIPEARYPGWYMICFLLAIVEFGLLPVDMT